MSEKTTKTVGDLVLSQEVIAKIASVAAKDVPGVRAVVAAPADIKGFIRKARSVPAVKVTNIDTAMIIDISLRLASGARIPDVAQAVQSSVKNAVQSMTGRVVSKVNVNIQDIDLSEEPAKKEK